VRAVGPRSSVIGSVALALALVFAAVVFASPGRQSASRPPVVLLIFDEFPGDALLGADGRIDAVRYPGFAELARTGWWFRDASTVFDDTRQAVPAILDARLPRPGGGRSRADHPQTIFDVFGRRGYGVVDSEDAESLCPPRWCPGGPSGNPDTIRNLRLGRAGRLRRFIGRIHRSRRPILYVKHALLPHVPYLFLPSGRRTRNGVRDPIAGMNSVRGYGDSFLTRHNEQRFLLQAGYADLQVRRLIRRLKRTGLWDRAVVAVTADHGMSFEVGVKNRRLISRGNVDEVGPVPLFVKGPHQRRGRASRRLVRTVDVMPTLADLANVPVTYRIGGGSAFGPAARRRRSIRIPTRNFGHAVVISASRWRARRRAVVRRRIARYGSGGLASLYTGIGPNRRLIGHTLAELHPARAGRVRARFSGGGRLRHVSKRSAIAPTQIAGTLRGGRRGAKRDVAVAVNGRIEAVGRTWRLRGRRGECFALNVPERSLHGGRNRVVLLEVRSRGRAVRVLGRI
jgi:sulfatase-like protein